MVFGFSPYTRFRGCKSKAIFTRVSRETETGCFHGFSFLHIAQIIFFSQVDVGVKRKRDAAAHHGRDYGTDSRLYGQRVHQARAPGKHIDAMRSRQDSLGPVDQSWR